MTQAPLSPSGEDVGLARITRALDEICGRTADSPVMILLEVTAGQGTVLGGRFEHIAQLLENSAAPERLGVCFDTCHAFAAGGAEIIFAPHASPACVGDRKNVWLKYLPARAYDNSVYIAACNLTGEDGGQTFCGGAIVLDPKGNVITQAFPGREDLLIADPDPALINTIRGGESASMRHSFFLAGRRPELYGELIKEKDFRSRGRTRIID